MTQPKGLDLPFGQAAGRARELSRPVLVSQSKQVQWIDPLAFFTAGQTAGQTAYAGERVYWSDPTKELILVGIGTAYKFQSQSGNQYQEVETDWRRMLKESVISPPVPLPGVGPLLIGGFSFDPNKEKTDLWRQFPDTRMVLPTFVLSAMHGKTWLTTNLLLYPWEDAAAKADEIAQAERHLLDRLRGVSYPAQTAALSYQEVAAAEWMAAVDRMALEIREGGLDKIVLARELRVQSNRSFLPDNVLARLHEEQPASYLFAIESGEQCFVGASPERLVKRQGDTLLSTCLAGSIRRGNSVSEDQDLGQQLLRDEKNLHEHEVVVHMIREALAKVCENVQAPLQPSLYKVRDIQHLYTPVTGQANAGVSILSVVEQLHPTPALGGFPQDLALLKIREHEHLDRGWYGAPVGWMDSLGNGEFAVAIRSGLLQGKQASLFAGCGIVGDSDPVSEYQETQLKFKPMLSALGGKGNDN